MEKLKEVKKSCPVSLGEETDDRIEDVSSSSDCPGDLPLMDWEKGVVGWDSGEDTMNPL
jgi:hypothetical protein